MSALKSIKLKLVQGIVYMNQTIPSPAQSKEIKCSSANQLGLGRWTSSFLSVATERHHPMNWLLHDTFSCKEMIWPHHITASNEMGLGHVYRGASYLYSTPGGTLKTIEQLSVVWHQHCCSIIFARSRVFSAKSRHHQSNARVENRNWKLFFTKYSHIVMSHEDVNGKLIREAFYLDEQEPSSQSSSVGVKLTRISVSRLCWKVFSSKAIS